MDAHPRVLLPARWLRHAPNASGVREPAARTAQRAARPQAKPPEAATAADAATAAQELTRLAAAEIDGEGYGPDGSPPPHATGPSRTDSPSPNPRTTSGRKSSRCRCPVPPKLLGRPCHPQHSHWIRCSSRFAAPIPFWQSQRRSGIRPPASNWPRPESPTSSRSAAPSHSRRATTRTTAMMPCSDSRLGSVATSTPATAWVHVGALQQSGRMHSAHTRPAPPSTAHPLAG